MDLIMMTLEQFRATRRYEPNLMDCNFWPFYVVNAESVPSGYVYLDCLYIEKIGAGFKCKHKPGDFYLLIDRCDYVGALADLEAILYTWAIDEGYSL